MSLESQLRAILDPLVNPNMRESWEENWKSWFVTTQEVEDQRKPGKLKIEFGMQKGEFIALAPKTYICFDETNESAKIGTKGLISLIYVNNIFKVFLTRNGLHSKLFAVNFTPNSIIK